MKRLMRWLSLTLIPLFAGCTGLPKDVTPVQHFQPDRYLGKWYEIARLDHPFERGLSHVTATYQLRSDGGIEVTNRGFSQSEQRWKEAKGKAYFMESRDKGHLKVSFFGPFYSSYVIWALDNEQYKYAFISGYNHSTLWLLARSPSVSHDIVQQFIKRAKAKGFATDKLIFVNQAPLP